MLIDVKATPTGKTNRGGEPTFEVSPVKGVGSLIKNEADLLPEDHELPEADAPAEEE